ncbi:MAG: SAM-dependent methyltransferase [Planctomycetaceae bacterium]|nr:SAM-dependent methyltransferase [Planctomycetaceae bacterium]
MASDSTELHTLLQDALRRQILRKAVFSKPARRSDDTPSRVDVRPVEISGQWHVQLTTRRANQDHHRNLSLQQAEQELPALLLNPYLDLRLETETEEIVARHTRKGVCRLQRKALSTAATVETTHNRRREYLIPDDRAVPFLVETGIMSSGGRVRDQHRKKFRQINRFAEFIRDVIRQLAIPAGQRIRVVDFGCGKSYLTFATHYLLSEILRHPATIVGLDRRDDVIATCRGISDRLGLTGLKFEVGDIAGYQPEGPVDVSISLHACDTATDDAIAVAAGWQAKAILAVPCCQHELAGQLTTDRLPVLSRDGIIHERFASLATDSIRARLLECIGYRTTVMEFIETEHTPKNLLIRAIRRQERMSDSPDPQYWGELLSFQQQLGVSSLRLQQKLEECGLLRPPARST